jgi:hypothetical protein
MDVAFELSDEKIKKLREKAEEYGLPPKKLLEAGIEDFLNQPDEQFKEDLNYILRKNSELYERLS